MIINHYIGLENVGGKMYGGIEFRMWKAFINSVAAVM